MLKEVACGSDINTPIKPMKGADSGANSVDMGPRFHRIAINSNERRVVATNSKDPAARLAARAPCGTPPPKVDCAPAQISSRHLYAL